MVHNSSSASLCYHGLAAGFHAIMMDMCTYPLPSALHVTVENQGEMVQTVEQEGHSLCPNMDDALFMA